jgi:tight adherence protein B
MLPLLAAAVLVLIGVAMLAAAIVARKRARQEWERRTSLIVGAKTSPAKKADAFGGLLKAKTSPFDAHVRSFFTVGIKRTWAMTSGSFRLLLVAATSAGVVWNLMSGIFGFSSLISGAACLAAGYLAPRRVLAKEQKKTETKFAALFPDAVDTISRMVRAGLPIAAAVRTVAIESPPPVSTVFAAVGDQVRIGVPIEVVLNDSSATVGLADFRFFTIAIALQHETGGNLTQALENLSDLMRKRRAARLKAKAATGEIRMTAYTLTAIPVITVGALVAIQPGYLLPLLVDSRGHVIIASAVGCLLAAVASMQTLMRTLTTD